MNEPLRVALVTGSSRRLGRALVEALAEGGARVFIHHRGSPDEALEVQSGIEARGGQAHLVEGDVGSPEAMVKLMAEVQRVAGRLDILVNNVGQYRLGSLLELEPSHFESTLQSNLLGPYHLIQQAIPLMESGGQIINIGYTGLGALGSSPSNTAYVISKTGLLILTRTYAELLGPEGIRVNMVSPGQLDNSVDLPEDFADHVPLGRPGSVNDVVEAVRFLTSTKAGYITGQNLEVAGGYMQRVRDHAERPK